MRRLPITDIALAAGFAASVVLAWTRTPARLDIVQTAARAGAPVERVAGIPPRQRATRGRSPFRLDGGLVAHVVESTGGPVAQAALPPPTPVVAVRAIVGGPPWQALLRGLPPSGADRVARPGDRFGSVEVRAIGAEFVVLTSADSSWTITLPSRGR